MRRRPGSQLYTTLESIEPWSKTRERVRKAVPKELQLYPYIPAPVLDNKVSLWQGNITKLAVDAIVNSTDPHFSGGGWVDLAVHRAAGPRLDQECLAFHGCPTGQARISSGHLLPAKYILHTVAPSTEVPGMLKSCYESCFELVLKHRIRSVAFCCIATGSLAYSNDGAAEIALSVTRNWLEKYHDQIERVVFCVYRHSDYYIYQQKLCKFFPAVTTGPTTDEYLDACHHVLATQECLEMWFLKVILLGFPRLGKTTMRRRLTGEINDISSSGEGEQPSTGIVESSPSIVIRNLSSTTALVTESNWVAAEGLTDETCAILQYFYSHVSEKQVLQSSESEASGTDISTNTESNTEEGKEASNEEGQLADTILADFAADISSLPPASSNHESYSPPPQYRFSIPEMIRNAVSPECWREITQVCSDTALLKIGDAGGQPEFMDMQPALTVGPALYLFFCKLTDDLDSPYKVSYLSPSTGESTLLTESTYTAKEILFKSLASIACLKSSPSTSLGETTSSTANQLLASCSKSVAYIVGTHKDLMSSEEQIDEFDEKLQDCIRRTDFFKKGIVRFFSEERMILPVDNMHGGSNEVDSVRKVLEEVLKKHFEKLSIPASWFILSLCLRKREERMASLESVMQLASELGIPEKEAMVALWFLHHYAGVLMYFPNLPELKDTVICDSQIIYDSATTLIVNTFEFGSVGKAASEWFRKTGQFSLEDIRRATAGISGDCIPLKKLVKLLAYLNILVSFVQCTSTSLSSHTPSSEEMYFMPSVLPNATHKEMAKWWDDTHKQVTPAPLFITYQCGFVPIGVFPAMIASLTAERSLKLRVKGIRKNRVEFQFGRDFDTITLVSQPTYYAVHISRRKRTKTPTHEVCAAIRRLVEFTLKAVIFQMNYSDTFTAEYQLGFECPSHPGREHLCVVDSDDPSPYLMCCQEDMDDLEAMDMESQHLVWFGEDSYGDNSGSEAGLTVPVALTKFSLNNILGVLKGLSPKNYLKLSLELGLDKNTYDKFETVYPKDLDRVLAEIINWWMKNKVEPKPSWQELRRALSEVQPNITC